MYRPVFKAVSQVSSLAAEANDSYRITPLAILAGISATALAGYGILNFQPNLIHKATESFSKMGIRRIGDVKGSAFWAGMALATTANVFIAAGAIFWIAGHLDIHQDFTKYASHKPIRSDVVIQRKVDQAKAQRKSLDPQKWRQFALTSKVRVSPNVYRLVFALNKSTDVLGLPIGQHIAIRANIDGKDVQRSYTPISNDKDLGRIELCIKVYSGGLITNYLANLNIGDKVEIRGPKGAMTYSKTLVKHMGMIAGGTGITPMYQLIRAIVEDDSDKTTVSLLYANNTEEDILMRDELESFAQLKPEKFQIHHVLSRAPEDWSGLRGFVTEQHIKDCLPPPSNDTKILMCGPPGMIEAEKKNLVNLGFDKPRAMSKMEDQVFMF